MNILEKIVETKKQEIAVLESRPATADRLAWAVKGFGPRRNFKSALLFPKVGKVGLIAEIKKASPSAGIISPDFDAVRIARQYELAGADCLSVLTDVQYFQGSLEFLKSVREAVALPLLRKDFIIHERQILEAIEWGADAVLLIAAILTDDQLQRFRLAAESVGLTALVEVHDELELDRALNSGATVIGVNNRDLKTFTVDLAVTERLAAKINKFPEVMLVAESGIKSRADVQRLEKAGAKAILVGETLMRDGNVSSKVREILA
ncbi:MAG: indole-3-glycerol phosphate synthase TrpC [Verrucomicrobiota bacterium]|nr:indole-3-glycerol phosphate synthase TrpC [Verrucomicrobiota bacterium]